ncbi:MAG: hypothetical protein E7547_01115 [Ruminococcaceae bacterium]|nr:hypothetical protein [Oscillospiraceae bacterium]
MKKVLAICLAVVMVISAGVMAFAQGGFVSSPSGNKAPVIVTVTYGDNSCRPEIIVTPYVDKETLEDYKEQALIDAYNEILNCDNLADLCSGLIALAAELGRNVRNFAISDLFDISAYHTLPHDYCGTITLTLNSETLTNFVGLLHRNSEGVWELIPNVVVDYDNNTITFTVNNFSPFAIVVDTAAEDAPNTGSSIYIPAIVMCVSAVSLAAVLISLKKKQRA